MATTKTLKLAPYLPEGGSANAYLDPEWSSRANPPASGQSTAALGAVVDTQTVTGGAVTFVGLTDKRQYVAGLDLGGGVWEYVHFDSF